MAQNFLDLTAGSNQGNFSKSDAVSKTSTVDTIAGNSTTTETVAIGGSTTGYINDGADLDWFAVDLVAGQRYTFNTAGNGATPISDTTLTLFNSGSTQVAFNDDTGAGLYSEISFTAPTSGTYYLQVDGYGTTLTGGYSLSAAVAPPATSVLPTLDWGTQITPTNNVINVYFANNGETFDGQTSIGWDAVEESAAMAAFDQFSNYINVTFNVVNTAAASDIKMVQVGTLGGGTLGYFNPPGTTNQGVGVFADDGAGWDPAGLEQGGYGFITLIHEIGHGLGLAHPHDNGGISTTMAGVTGPQGDYGTYNLNQGIFTMMSYNDGWPVGPNSGVATNNAYGWAGTAMALDIAILQDKYGENLINEGGNSSYALSANNASGTFYSSIWDTGGVDTISFGGSANATLDLREATLLEETNGGGYVSYVAGVHGGYTIANGVVIENATGGTGDDTLNGNDVRNVLRGGAGADSFSAGGGNDVIYVDANDVSVNGGAGVDSIIGSGTINLTNLGLNSVENILGSAGADNFTAVGMAASVNIYAGGGNDVITGGNGDDTLRGEAGSDELYGGNGSDILYFDADDTIVNGGSGWDFAYGSGNIDLATIDFTGTEQIQGSNGVDNFTAATMTTAVRVYGNAGNDTFTGGSGDDYFYGGADSDTLIGNLGTDRLIGQAGVDYLYGGAGVDYLYIDGDDAIIDGGAGWDIAIIDGNIVLTDTNRNGTEQFFGRNNVDILDGSALTSDIRLYGYGGNDTLTGGAGNDYLYSGTGADKLYGGAGNDSLTIDGSDTVVDGGTGTDTAIGNGTLNLNAMGMTGVENIVGGTGNDSINSIGMTENLTLYGRGGNDVLTGGSGADRLHGEAGADSLYGGAGSDYLYFDATDTIVNGGADWDFGVASGSINLAAVGLVDVEQIIGSGGVDVFDASGLTQDIRLFGNAGNDTLIGGTGNDYFYGQGDVDTFVFGNNFGVDILADFANDGLETINLANVTNIVDYADLVANHVTTDAANNVVIFDGTDTVTVQGYILADMDAADFLF